MLRHCAALGRAALVDTLECCEVCHSAEKYRFCVLGPCRVTLPDGREAFVCCSNEKRLQTAGRDRSV